MDMGSLYGGYGEDVCMIRGGCREGVGILSGRCGKYICQDV